MSKLDRVEIWDEVAAKSGVALDVVPVRDRLIVADTERLEGCDLNR